MSDNTEYSYSYSVDGNYKGSFDTREAALADAVAGFPDGAFVYIGVRRKLSAADFVSVEDVTEGAMQRAYEEAGEASESWMEVVTDEQRTELENLLVAWVEKHHPVDFWCVDNIHKFDYSGTDHGPA